MEQLFAAHATRTVLDCACGAVHIYSGYDLQPYTRESRRLVVVAENEA